MAGGAPPSVLGFATGALNFLTKMGLFIGQSPAFFQLFTDLAEDADAAKNGRA